MIGITYVSGGTGYKGNCEQFQKEAGLTVMHSTKFYRVAIAIGLMMGFLLVSIEYYPAKDLLAAFIIFTVLVAMIGAPLLVLILLEELAVEVLPRTGTLMMPALGRNRDDFILYRRRLR